MRQALLALQAESGLDLAEGADRSDKGSLADGHMGIAGLSLPNTASMENLHGGGQSHPFNSAGAMQPATPCVITLMLLHVTPCPS